MREPLKNHIKLILSNSEYIIHSFIGKGAGSSTVFLY